MADLDRKVNDNYARRLRPGQGFIRGEANHRADRTLIKG